MYMWGKNAYDSSLPLCVYVRKFSRAKAVVLYNGDSSCNKRMTNTVRSARVKLQPTSISSWISTTKEKMLTIKFRFEQRRWFEWMFVEMQAFETPEVNETDTNCVKTFSRANAVLWNTRKTIVSSANVNADIRNVRIWKDPHPYHV